GKFASSKQRNALSDRTARNRDPAGAAVALTGKDRRCSSAIYSPPSYSSGRQAPVSCIGNSIAAGSDTCCQSTRTSSPLLATADASASSTRGLYSPLSQRRQSAAPSVAPDLANHRR